MKNLHPSKVEKDFMQIVVISSKRPTNKLPTSENIVKKLNNCTNLMPCFLMPLFNKCFISAKS